LRRFDAVWCFAFALLILFGAVCADLTLLGVFCAMWCCLCCFALLMLFALFERVMVLELELVA
jgi:hypothetical protein